MKTQYITKDQILREQIEAGIEPTAEQINLAVTNHRRTRAVHARKKRRHNRRQFKNKKRR